MTSKEALKRLRQETAPATYMPDFDKKECCDVIERDLEILDILKKYIRAGQWSNEYTLLSWEMKAKELTKIKEWLNNE